MWWITETYIGSDSITVGPLWQSTGMQVYWGMNDMLTMIYHDKNITLHIKREQHLGIWENKCAGNTRNDINILKSNSCQFIFQNYLEKVAYKHNLVMNFHTERQEVAICDTKPCYICYLYALEYAGKFCHKQLGVDAWECWST